MIYRKTSLILICLLMLIPTGSYAQFQIKIPEINKPRPTKTESPATKDVDEVQTQAFSGQNRQMVMDDGFTFFDAEPVEEYDSSARLNKDIGWYMKSHLRVLGDFPKRSAFRVAVKKNGKLLAENRCEGEVYTKEGDSDISNELRRKERDLTYENYMQQTIRCYDETAVIKDTGKLNVEIYVINGDTDAEKLVRTYKIDVRRSSRVRGSAVKPQPDVAHYYIARHAEAAVAFIHLAEGNANYFKKPFDNYSSPQFKTLVVHMSYTPGRDSKMPYTPFARCSVNGQRLSLDWDKVNIAGDTALQEYAVYTDRIAPQYNRGSAYRDDMIFRRMRLQLPLYTGETQYSKPRMKIENTPGDWECTVVNNGKTIRTFRWKVGGDGRIVPHPEQANGNINLFHNAFLVDVEIPAGGTSFDYRMAPLPEDGLFYGVPWSTPEGKAMAEKVPRKGNLYHVPSNKAQ